MKFAFTLFVVLASYANSALSEDSFDSFPFDEVLATKAHIKQLRAGGYVIYIRHGNTDNSRADRSPSVDLNDCSTQRVLSKEGVQVMTMVGNEIRNEKIPIGDIITSPMCRVKHSARLLFNTDFKVDSLLMYSSNMTSEEKIPVIEKTREILSTLVAPGKNRVMVAHAPNLMDLMGYFPKEGTFVIFKPLGNSKYEYIASILPKHWKNLHQ